MEALVASVFFMILFSEYKAGCCPILFGARFYKKVTNKTIYRTNFVEKRNRFYFLIMFFFTKSVFLKLFLYYDQTAIINRNYKFHSIRKKNKRHLALSFHMVSEIFEYKFEVKFSKNSVDCKKTKTYISSHSNLKLYSVLVQV